MKRSYPYTGPGASPSQPQSQQISNSATPSNPQTPDYSAYGYGANSTVMSGNATAGLSQEAQQAQWHQQWQQYYAQQAASTAGGVSQQVASQSRPPQQPQQLQQQPQAQMQQQPFGFQQPQYFPQQFPQQVALPQTQQIHGSPFPWPNQQQNGMDGLQQQQQQQHYNPVLGQNPQAQQQQHMFNANVNNANNGPPAKRQRFDNNNYQPNGGRPVGAMNPMAGQAGGAGFQANRPTGPSAGIGPQAFPSGGNPAWQSAGHNAGNGSMRTGPMRGGAQMSPMGTPYLGGPSNMAGPMAASPPGIRAPITPMADRRAGGITPNRLGHGRGPAMPNRPSIPSNPGSSGKFNGPVGVNALSAQGRGGFGGRGGHISNMSARRPDIGPRNGIPSGPSGKGNRFEHGKGKASVASKVSVNKASGGFELNKAPAVNSRTSTLADQPVPPSSKRTFSDFKIKAIAIDPLEWQWQQIDEDEEEEEEELGVGGEDDDETMQSINDVDSIDGSIQGRKKSRLGKRRDKMEASKETSRLRICFAANLPPPGAPTGPKALSKSGEKPQPTTASEKSEATDAGPEWTAFSRGPPQSSTNRISISYGSSKRRLVIDSDVIKSIELNRAQGTLKISINVMTAAGVKRKDQLEKKKGEEWVVVKGVLLEGRESEMDNFSAISRRQLERSWRERGEEEVEPEIAQTDEEVEGREVDVATTTKVKEEDDPDESSTSVQGGAGEEKVENDDVDDVDGDTAEGDVKQAEEAEAEAEIRDVVWQDYASFPPFYRLLAHHDGPTEDEDHAAVDSTEMIITVTLADLTPKQEPRWVKTGDVEEWLSALPGFQSSFASTSGARIVHAWTDKIRIVDPDPPPTVTDVLEDWSGKSFVGSLADRRRFLQDHSLQSLSGISDLICKLVRGERAIPIPSVRELGEPLKEAMESSSFHQNHLTLSILAIVRLVKEFAGLAGVDDETVEAKIQEIFLCLPTHLIFRACDGLLKESLEKQRLIKAGKKVAAQISMGVAAASRDGSSARSEVLISDEAGEKGARIEEEKGKSGKEKKNSMGEEQAMIEHSNETSSKVVQAETVGLGEESAEGVIQAVKTEAIVADEPESSMTEETTIKVEQPLDFVESSSAAKKTGEPSISNAELEEASVTESTADD